MKRILRGFTLVELLVVITVFAIMAGGITLAYTAGQKQARAAQAQTIARTIASAAEKYHTKNNEYPSSTDMAGATIELTDSEIQNAASILEVKPDSLKGASARDFRISPCNQTSAPNCPLNTVTHAQAYVYYVTRANTGGSGTITSNLYNSNCTVTIPSAVGSTAFFVAYYNPYSNKWVLHRSKHGNVSVSGSCSFS